jgi:TRAP-type transport system periplasmic protein
MTLINMKRLLCFIIALAISISISPAKKTKIKMATLAPEGTEWHGLLMKMGQEWKEATLGQVNLRVYPGGVVGDERDMIRKMRIGQIQGAAITSEGLTEINPQYSVFFVPMLYQNFSDLDLLYEKLGSDLIKDSEKNGFKVLMMVDVGWVYWFSSDSIHTPDDLRKQTIFSWAGDYRTAALWEKSGFKVVPLAMTDMLSGLQTGMIDAMAFNPMYVLSQQSFGITKYMLDMKWGTLSAAVVLDIRTWNKIDPEHQIKMQEISNKISTEFQKKNRLESDSAINVMKEYGLTVTTPTKNEYEEWKTLVESMYPLIRGQVVEENIFDRVMEFKDELESNP